MKTINAALVAVGLAGALGAAQVRTLHPSSATVLRMTEPASDWPGWHVDAKDWMPVDLSEYGWMETVVSNRTARPLEIMLSVKGQAVQGKTPGGFVALAPHEAGRIVCALDPIP